MRVLVAGAGIGGLALAQGLRRTGVDVTVVERDTDLATTGGYRLHLGPEAVAALRELLPPQRFETLMASSAGSRRSEAALRDHRGRLLLRAEGPQSGVALDVDRITLRTILSEGLDDALRLGTECTTWQVTDAGVQVSTTETRTTAAGARVHAPDDDTTPAPSPHGSDPAGTFDADVLVIANGPGSPLVQELAGTSVDEVTDFVSITGRTTWQDVEQQGRDFLQHAPHFSVGPAGVAVFATHHDPVGGSLVRSTRARPATVSPTVIWGLIVHRDQLTPTQLRRLRTMEQVELTDLATTLLDARHWHAPLRNVVARAEIGSVSGYRLHASDPDHLAPWPAGVVTALGDAVHAMPPTGGRGAATAILSAAALVHALGAVTRGEVTVPVAVEAYEDRMRRHAAPAVRESSQPLAWIRAGSGPTGAAAVRTLTPVVAGTTAAIRRVRSVTTRRRPA